MLENKISFSVNSESISFSRTDWRYVEGISINLSTPTEYVQTIREKLKAENVCVFELKKFPQTIYVFDIEYDDHDARVYSLDEDLRRFKAFQRDIEISPKGDLFGYDNPKFVDKIEDRYYYEIERLGVDLKSLVGLGFHIAKKFSVSEDETKRRFLQRTLRKELPKELDGTGLEVEDVKIDALKFTKKTDVTRESSVVTDSENGGDETTVSEDPGAFANSGTNTGFFKKVWGFVSSLTGFFVTLLVTLAAVIGILEYLNISYSDLIEQVGSILP